MKKDKIDLALVKEKVVEEQALSKHRTYKDLTAKEKDLFKEVYPMTPDQDLAKQFLISVNDCKSLAYEMQVYKDPAFTQYQMSDSQGKAVRKADDGSPKAPGYLLTAVTKMCPEEEARQIMNMYGEGLDPLEILNELIIAQLFRVRQGIALENENKGSWRAVNDSVDTLHAMLRSAHELEHGQRVNHVLNFDQMILRSQGRDD